MVHDVFCFVLLLRILSSKRARVDHTTHQRPVTETTEQSEHSPGIDELQTFSLTFVNDLDVPEVQVQGIQQQDEYETDSDTERDDEVEFEVVSKTCMARSGREVRAFLRRNL